ncbi:MraY family glycosyltransferase [Streptomyces nodosus]|uniref:MraY family glycosyltransferase n=1 Tax=Streptomyces nodosus TaxID=40318 RepID=UPI0036E390BB
MRECLLSVCIAAAVTYLLTAPVRKFAIASGAAPRLGGIAIFGGLCAGLLVASHLADLSVAFGQSNEPRALLSGTALLWLIGVLDDRFGISTLLKLGGQMIAAGVMVMQGLTILWLPLPGVGNVALSQFQGTLLTVALIVTIIRAVDFVDGLDGLAVGMVCISSTAFFLYAYRIWHSYGIESAAPATLFAAILIGVSLGFLPHNTQPARIHLGDSGSMILGAVLAAGAISISGKIDPGTLNLYTHAQKEAMHPSVPVHIPLLMPLTVIAVPVADLMFVTVRRFWRGRSPFSEDRNHLHHLLLDVGHSYRRTLLIMYYWSALIAFSALGYFVYSISIWLALSVAIFSVIGLVLTLSPRFTLRARRWCTGITAGR